MTAEYILKIGKRRTEPLTEPGMVLVEAGVDAEKPEALIAALENLLELLRLLKTPEKVAKYMHDHASAAKMLGILRGK